MKKKITKLRTIATPKDLFNFIATERKSLEKDKFYQKVKAAHEKMDKNSEQFKEQLRIQDEKINSIKRLHKLMFMKKNLLPGSENRFEIIDSDTSAPKLTLEDASPKELELLGNSFDEEFFDIDKQINLANKEVEAVNKLEDQENQELDFDLSDLMFNSKISRNSIKTVKKIKLRDSSVDSSNSEKLDTSLATIEAKEVKQEPTPITNNSSSRHESNNIYLKENEENIPKSILGKELKDIYKYDAIQLVEALKQIELKPRNIYKMIDFLTYIRKKKQLRIYDFPEISKYLQFIKENMNIVNNSYLVSFFYTLSKFNFDSDANQQLVYDILSEISKEERVASFDVRLTSNLLMALQNFHLKSPKNFNFDDFFTKLETFVISLLSNQKANVDSQSVANIVLAYCKTQNGSTDFYYALQNFIIHDMKIKLTNQEFAIVLYSYSNNDACTDRLLEEFHDDIILRIKKFKPMELASILRAYNKRNLLTDQLKKEFHEVFTDKHMLMNPLDISYFYSILVEGGDDYAKKHKTFLKIIHQCIDKLKSSFTSFEFSILFEKGKELQNYDYKLMEQLKHQILYIMRSREAKGAEMAKILGTARKLKFEGKYNTFKEAIDQYLVKINYQV